jgi:protein TorT
MTNRRRILLVEDDPKDVELILATPAKHNLANNVAIARKGAGMIMDRPGSRGKCLAASEIGKTTGSLSRSGGMGGGGTRIGGPAPGAKAFQGKLIWSSLWMMIALFSTPFLVQAVSRWYPFPVEVPTTGSILTAENTVIDYVPLEKAQRRWSLCASFPHMKDSYWLAVNFGLAREVDRLGVQMRLYQAGGYDNLSMQIAQIKACIAQGADGVIIGAISYHGLDSLVDKLYEQGVPVVDLVNGMSSDKVAARSLVSFEEMGYRAGEYIARLHPKTGKPVGVAWFPGPSDAGWVKNGDKGFRRALAGSSAEILAMRFGDTGKAVQTALIEEVLDAYAGIDIIAGTAVTAEAAVRVLRIRGLSDRIKVVAYYFTPEVYREIKRGHVLCAPTDSPVIQGRVAVDQMVRVLEHESYHQKVGPHIYVIDGSNVGSIDRSTSLAPGGFQATYSINVRLRMH